MFSYCARGELSESDKVSESAYVQRFQISVWDWHEKGIARLNLWKIRKVTVGEDEFFLGFVKGVLVNWEDEIQI